MALKFANGRRHPLESAFRKIGALEHSLVPRSDGEKSAAYLVATGIATLGDFLIATRRQEHQFSDVSIAYIVGFAYITWGGIAGAIGAVWHGAKFWTAKKNKEEKK